MIFFLLYKGQKNFLSFLKNQKSNSPQYNQKNKRQVHPSIASERFKTVAKERKTGITKSGNGVKHRMKNSF